MTTERTERVGIFAYDYFPIIGGGGRHLVEIVKRLPDGSVVVFSGQKNDLPCHCGKLARLPHGFVKQFLLSVWLNLRIRSVIRKLGLQRVNIHTGPGGLFLLRSPGVPVVVTAHHTYWQQCHQVPSQSWKRCFVPLERSTLSRAERVICVSEDTRQVVVDTYKVPCHRTRVIPSGVDPSVFRPLRDVEETPKSLLFLGRLEKRKGVGFLLRAMLRVVREEPAVVLFIAGRGRVMSKLMKFVADNGLTRNVRFLGQVSDGVLNEWYNRVSGFVMPSLFEGFGIPVIEAMAAGTPVIGTDVDGIRCLIEDGKTGLLVAYGDEAAMAQAILRVCRGDFVPPDDLIERTRAAHDWASVAERYHRTLLDKADRLPRAPGETDDQSIRRAHRSRS